MMEDQLIRRRGDRWKASLLTVSVDPIRRHGGAAEGPLIMLDRVVMIASIAVAEETPWDRAGLEVVPVGLLERSEEPRRAQIIWAIVPSICEHSKIFWAASTAGPAQHAYSGPAA